MAAAPEKKPPQKSAVEVDLEAARQAQEAAEKELQRLRRQRDAKERLIEKMDPNAASMSVDGISGPQRASPCNGGRSLFSWTCAAKMRALKRP